MRVPHLSRTYIAESHDRSLKFVEEKINDRRGEIFLQQLLRCRRRLEGFSSYS